jgi:hypothetical protein
MDDNAHLLQPVQNSIRAVGAIIAVEQEIGDADQTVEGNPFNQERAFVLDAGYSRNAHDQRDGRILQLPSSWTLVPSIRPFAARDA